MSQKIAEKYLHGEKNTDAKCCENAGIEKSVNDACTNEPTNIFDAEESMLSVKTSKLKFILSVSIVISSMLFNGTIYGYTSPALLSMRQSAASQNNSSLYNINNNNSSSYNAIVGFKHRDIVLNDSEASWVSSLSSLGFVLGGLTSGLFLRLLGRKYSSLLGLGLSYVIGYALIAFAPTKEYIYAGRFFGGICQGFCNCVTTLYTLELCQTTRQKALCGVLLSVLGNLGTLLTYVLGVFLNWRELAMALMFLSVPYLLGMLLFVPETSPPRNLWLNMNSVLQFRKLDKNESALCSDTSNSQSDTNSNKSFGGSIREKFYFYKSILTGLILMFAIQFGGYNVVSLYAATILQMDADNIIRPEHATSNTVDQGLQTDPTALWAAVGVAVAGLVGVLLGVLFVQRGFNRKKMLVISALGITITFIALGTYLLLQTGGDNSATQLWITTFSLIIHLLLFNLGYGCLGFPVVAEILPESFRSKGLALITFSAGIFGFLNSKSYLDLKYYFGSGVTFLIYGVINFFGGIFIQFCLPDLQS